MTSAEIVGAPPRAFDDFTGSASMSSLSVSTMRAKVSLSILYLAKKRRSFNEPSLNSQSRCARRISFDLLPLRLRLRDARIATTAATALARLAASLSSLLRCLRVSPDVTMFSCFQVSRYLFGELRTCICILAYW